MILCGPACCTPPKIEDATAPRFITRGRSALTFALNSHIGYSGKGLATEAASAWVRAAFDDFHLDRLGAFVHPGNVASIRVLEKLGFHAAGRETVMGMNSILFSLGAKDVCLVDRRLTRPMS